LLGLKPGRLYTRIREPYFFSFVRDQLIAQYGAQTVRSGGLRVYTTIDRRFQRAALASIRKTLDRPTDPAAALVSIDPRTGAIRAMTSLTPGSRRSQFNLVAQARRQAGSTFKTFVLTAAVLQGINPETTTYVSAPFHYQPDPFTPAWNVSTYDHTYVGTTTVAHATLRSDNSVYAQLTLDVGPDKVAQAAHRLGITTDLSVHGAFVPSMGLGAIAVSPLEMASAYATLAAQGVYSQPMAIRKVIFAGGKKDTDSGWGRPLFRPPRRGQDGHDRQPRRRLVLRLHAEPRHDRVGRLPARGDPDDERARDRRCRRHLPGDDLEALHGERARLLARLRLPGAEAAAGVEAVHARPVRDQLGASAAARSSADDQYHDDDHDVRGGRDHAVDVRRAGQRGLDEQRANSASGWPTVTGGAGD
jgi:hypothetical protein